MNEIIHLMHYASNIISILSVLILLYGVTIGLIDMIKTEYFHWRGIAQETQRKNLRHQLGYYLLLSLEFLIAADIIETIIKPGLEELAILGGTLLIRTVISFSLSWELRQEE